MLKISRSSVSILFESEKIYKAAFTIGDSLQENIISLSNSILSVISLAEKDFGKHLKLAKLIIDFGPFEIQNIKLLKTSDLDFTKIRIRLEEDMGKKIVNISLNGGDGKYHFIQALTLLKADVQLIIDLVSELGIEVVSVKPDFKFVSEYCSYFYKNQKFVLMKFSENYLECALIKSDIIVGYQVYPEFGMNVLISEIQSLTDMPEEAICKIANYYNTTSKVDRLKVFYEREDEDFRISEFLISNTYVSNLQSAVKKKLDNILRTINRNFNLSLLAVYYECENYFKIDGFLPKNEYEVFQFQYQDIVPLIDSERRDDITCIFKKQVKKFFHLSS